MEGSGADKDGDHADPECDGEQFHNNNDLSVINELVRQNNPFFSCGI
jgi:hypothetical protein